MKVFLLLIIPAIILSAGLENIDDKNFTKVTGSDNVWVVKLYSEMCGSCQDFQPTWNSMSDDLKKSYNLAQINIDKTDGMNLAKKLSALREGIPALMVFLDGAKFELIFVDGMKKSEVMSAIDKLTNGFSKDSNGIFVKRKSDI